MRQLEFTDKDGWKKDYNDTNQTTYDDYELLNTLKILDNTKSLKLTSPDISNTITRYINKC